jgi:hypothetical protein
MNNDSQPVEPQCAGKSFLFRVLVERRNGRYFRQTEVAVQVSFFSEDKVEGLASCSGAGSRQVLWRWRRVMCDSVMAVSQSPEKVCATKEYSYSPCRCSVGVVLGVS